METFYHIVGGIYIVLGVSVVSFCLYILPKLVLEMLEHIPAGWLDTIQDYFYSIIAEIVDHFRDIEKIRHRKIDFSGWVQEVREINEGRRMPVSIRG